MKFDVYDTYATGPDGSLVHFDAIVPAGTEKKQVNRRIHQHVGSDNPEIEMELSRWKSSGHWAIDASIARECRRNGFAVIPIESNWKAAG